MENNLREKAINKLSSFLQNPGYFSILLLGENGTGKEFILKKILGEKITITFSHDLNYDSIISAFDSEIIVIKNIEELSLDNQNTLFKALSTKDGKIGFGEDKGLKRIIFTSALDIESLKNNNSISHRFLDRISQLVVKIPSFKEFSTSIKEDFKSVWVKMDFKEFEKFPEDGEFQFWLKENCGTFAGNFRDLDKIAILWHQYRIIEYQNNKQKFKSDIEARIFRKVREDFERFTHFPTQKTNNSNTFEFVRGETWEKIERDFKSQFKAWVKKEYSSIKEATKELNMPLRKMDKW